VVRLALLGTAWLLLAAWYWGLVHVGKRADQEREQLIRQFRATDHDRDVQGLRRLPWRAP
jgi:hypothetical protein